MTRESVELVLLVGLPVGIWPETIPTAERRNRGPRKRVKSVSMFHNVAARRRDEKTVFPLFQKFCFSLPTTVLRGRCPPSSAVGHTQIRSVFVCYSCCRGAFRRPILFPPLRVIYLASLPTGARKHYYFLPCGETERARVTDRQWERRRERTVDSGWRHEAGTIWKKGKRKTKTENFRVSVLWDIGSPFYSPQRLFVVLQSCLFKIVIVIFINNSSFHLWAWPILLTINV